MICHTDACLSASVSALAAYRCRYWDIFVSVRRQFGTAGKWRSERRSVEKETCRSFAPAAYVAVKGNTDNRERREERASWRQRSGGEETTRQQLWKFISSGQELLQPKTEAGVYSDRNWGTQQPVNTSIFYINYILFSVQTAATVVISGDVRHWAC